MNYDECYQQSNRIKLYDKAFDILKAKDLIYPCFETPDELDKKRKRLITRRMPPVYDRAALKLKQDEIKSLLDSGKNHIGDLSFQVKKLNLKI